MYKFQGRGLFLQSFSGGIHRFYSFSGHWQTMPTSSLKTTDQSAFRCLATSSTVERRRFPNVESHFVKSHNHDISFNPVAEESVWYRLPSSAGSNILSFLDSSSPLNERQVSTLPWPIEQQYRDRPHPSPATGNPMISPWTTRTTVTCRLISPYSGENSQGEQLLAFPIEYRSRQVAGTFELRELKSERY